MRGLPFFKPKKGAQFAGLGFSEGSGGGGGSYVLPIASASTLGGVKVGDGLTINGSGVLSVSGGGGSIVIADTEQEVGTYGNDTLYSRHFDISGLSGENVQFSVAGLKNCYVKIASLISTSFYGSFFIGQIKSISSIESDTPTINASFSTNVGSDMHFDLTVFYTK